MTLSLILAAMSGPVGLVGRLLASSKWFKVTRDLFWKHVEAVVEVVGRHHVVDLYSHLALGHLVWALERAHLTQAKELPHVDTMQRTKMMMAMTTTSTQPSKRLVLIGCGHSHAYVLKNWAMRKNTSADELVLVSVGTDTPYSGMLPGFIANRYTKEECHIDALRLCEYAGGKFINGRVVGLDVVNKTVMLESPHPPISYDVVSIDVGSSPELLSNTDANHLSAPVKPISQFVHVLQGIDERHQARRGTRKTIIAVVGGGAGGVEVLLALQARLGQDHTSFILISRSSRVCSSHNVAVSKLMTQVLHERGVDVRVGQVVTGLEKEPITMAISMFTAASSTTSSRVDVVDEVVWCTGAASQPWFQQSGLSVDKKGFILVGDDLAVINVPDKSVFACGDCASQVNHPRPKAGVFAVRQGPPLAANLRTVLLAAHADHHASLLQYIPQQSFLGIIGLGNSDAVASKAQFGIRGKWLWELKEWIDRTWMRSYQMLAGMSTVSGEPISESNDMMMRCSGCGSKIGAVTLSQAMSRVRPLIHARDEVVLGINQPSDCAVIRVGNDMLITETLDYFTSFWKDEFIFGRILAIHALSDCFAMGIEPVSAMCLAGIPHFGGNSALVQETLTRLMEGICVELARCRCSLVGGHTVEAPQLAAGLAIQGQVRHEFMRKGGLRIGDVLILTKPLGTGVLFAAHGRLLARGIWIDSALQSMLISNQAAGEIFSRHGIRACTDVTGFGLIGHLLEMIDATDMMEKEGKENVAVDVELLLDQVPMLPGAILCSQSGITSTLYRENHKAVGRIVSPTATTPSFALLFDPQTSGGLLASVPAGMAQEVIAQLQQAGYGDAQIVGHVTQASGGKRRIKVM